jgi:hypothetical protein
MMQLLAEDILDDGDLAGFTTKLQAALIALRPRITLMGPTNYYVNATTGSDSNTGATPSTAWQTLQHASDWLLQNVDANGQPVTINVADGTYAPVHITDEMIGGSAGITFTGNTANPTNCVISAQNNSCFWVSNGNVILQGFYLTAIGNTGAWQGFGIIATDNGRCHWLACNFGPCTVAHVIAAYGGGAGPVGSYTISGAAPIHCRVSSLGSGGIGGSTVSTISIIGTPNFSTAFVYVDQLGFYFLNAAAFVFAGGATGPRYFVGHNALLTLPNGSLTYFPGDTAGTPNAVDVPSPTGGIYSLGPS